MNKFKVTIEKCKTQVRSISFLGRNVGNSYFANRSLEGKLQNSCLVIFIMEKHRKFQQIRKTANPTQRMTVLKISWSGKKESDTKVV